MSRKISIFFIGIYNTGCWFSDTNLNSRLQGKGACPWPTTTCDSLTTPQQYNTSSPLPPNLENAIASEFRLASKVPSLHPGQVAHLVGVLFCTPKRLWVWSPVGAHTYGILLCIMHTHIFGPNFQEKNLSF